MLLMVMEKTSLLSKTGIWLVNLYRNLLRRQGYGLQLKYLYLSTYYVININWCTKQHFVLMISTDGTDF